MAFKDWSTTAALNATLPGINWAEGMAPAAINNSARQMMADLATRIRTTLDVTDYGATLDGVTDDYAAVVLTMAAAPARGARILIPDSALGMKVATKIVAAKPIMWLIGNIEITGPAGDWIFDNQANGGGIVGSGRGCTSLKLAAPGANAVTHATATSVLTADVVTSITINTAGTKYKSPPRVMLTGGGGTGATALATLSAPDGSGNCTLAALVVTSGGSGYTGAPTVTFTGGGAGAVKNNEAMLSHYSNYSIDCGNYANVVGQLHFGGWYCNYELIDILRTGLAATAIGIQFDSHTLGAAGTTGSYGGAYVNRCAGINSNIIWAVGHDSSTATTTRFDDIDATGVVLNGVRDFLFDNPVVQNPADLIFWNVTNVDGVIVTGGDFENSGSGSRCTASIALTVMTVTAIAAGALAVGQYVGGNSVLDETVIVNQLTGAAGSTGTYTVSKSQTVGSTTVHTGSILYKAQGSTGGFQVRGPLVAAHYGPRRVGAFGAGCIFEHVNAADTEGSIRFGSNGSLDDRMRNAGWVDEHHQGIHFSGDTMVYSSNIKLIDATHGDLDNVANNAFALFMTSAGNLVMRYATAGANPRTLVDIAEFDSTGLKMTNLPAASPGAGTKRFWYDPGDGNRVKFSA